MGATEQINYQLDKIQSSLNHSDVEEMDFRQEFAFLSTIEQRLLKINKLMDKQ